MSVYRFVTTTTGSPSFQAGRATGCAGGVVYPLTALALTVADAFVATVSVVPGR